jgi:hypothetical protein
MSYIGATPSQQLITPAVDYFSGNGAATTFTLTRSVTSVFSVRVVVNGVEQNPRTAYTINQAGNLVFDGAPSAGTNNIYVVYNSQVGQFVTPSPGTVQPSSISAGGPTWDVTGDLNVPGTVVSIRRENIQTSNYTLALTDNSDVVAMNNSGAATITIPPNSAVAFPVGTVVWITRVGGGTVTLAAGAGVTLTRTGNMSQNEELYVRKRGENSWIVVDAPTKPVGSGGTLTVAGGYNIFTFTATGASTFTLA